MQNFTGVFIFVTSSVAEPKRKRRKQARERASEDEEEEAIDGGHLHEDEELAMQLLAHSS